MVRKVNKPLAVKNFIDNNPLALAFVLEAITAYAVEQLNAPCWPYTKRSPAAALAQEALDMMTSGD